MNLRWEEFITKRGIIFIVTVHRFKIYKDPSSRLNCICLLSL